MQRYDITEEMLLNFISSNNIVSEREIKTVNGWIMFRCPFHEEENPSFGINIESGAYHCFACHVKGSFSDFARHFGYDVSSLPFLDIPSNSDYRKAREKAVMSLRKSLSMDNKFYNKKFVSFKDAMKDNPNDKYTRMLIKYAANRGISQWTIRRLNFGYIKYGIYRNRVVIPVYDYSGRKILWYEGRNATNDNSVPKYWRPKYSSSSMTLYNYANILQKDYAVVVEGIFDAIKLYNCGIPGVCIFSSKISDMQYALLSAFSKVLLAFDGDAAGKRAFSETLKYIKMNFSQGIGYEIYRVKLLENKDISDLNCNEIKNLLIKAKKLFTF